MSFVCEKSILHWVSLAFGLGYPSRYANLTKDAQYSTIVAAISAAIADNIIEWYGAGARLLQSLPMQQINRLSLILRYRVITPDGREITLLAKIPLRPEAGTLLQAMAIDRLRVQAEAEFVLLQRIADMVEQLPTELALTAIRPVAYLSPWNALIIEELLSVSVQKLFVKSRLVLDLYNDKQKLASALRRSGSWLQSFHQHLSQVILQPFDAPTMIEQVNGLITKLHEHVKYDDYFADLKTEFAIAARSLHQTGVPIAMIHSDFHLGNMLLDSQQRLAIIDVGGARSEAIYIDLAKVLTDLTVRKQQVISHGLFIRARALRYYEQVFLRAYFADDPEDALRFVGLYCARMVLNKWLSNELDFARLHWAKSLITLPMRLIMRHYFRHLIARYMYQFHILVAQPQTNT